MRRRIREEYLTPSVYRTPAWLVALCSVLMIAGLAGLVLAFAVGPNLDAWLWLVVSFLIFFGIAQGMLAWAATFRVAQARWTPIVNRIGHSAVSFLPVLYLVMIVLLIWLRDYMPWVTEPVPAKSFYLNVPFMVVRNVLGVAVLFILDFLLVRRSFEADRKVREGEEITERDQSRLTALGLAVVLAYVVVGSIVAFDFVMAFSPEWVSTMFAPYFWVTNMYAAMAVMILIAGILRRFLARGAYLGASQFQDMGNLMLGFGFFSMGLFFAQYLTIWYGNLPWETPFIITRYLKGPWPWLAWTAFILEFGIPFLMLQSRRLKRTPRMLMPVAAVGLLGFVIERYVMVVPSLFPRDLLLFPLGGLMLLFFAGAFVLAINLFLSRYQPVSTAEAALPPVGELETIS